MTAKSIDACDRSSKASRSELADLEIDAWRAFVFPNDIRALRKQRMIGSLLQLSESIPGLTYIRLSKIERGEVFARAAELREIASALEVGPLDLLVDIDAPEFDIGEWAEAVAGSDRSAPEADRLAVLIGSAVRARRMADDALTIAAIEHDYGIPPVILSRIENAQKTYDRWNNDIRTGLRHLLDAPTDAALYEQVTRAHEKGELDAVLPLIANPRLRIEKTRSRVAALRRELSEDRNVEAADNVVPFPQTTEMEVDGAVAPAPAASATVPPAPRLVPVFGVPHLGGTIARVQTDKMVEVPSSAGPHAYGLHVCRSTLGPGLPGRATLIVDPDRYPTVGGLAVIEHEDGTLRVLSITQDRQGNSIGFSMAPDFELAIDEIDPARVASIVAAVFD